MFHINAFVPNASFLNPGPDFGTFGQNFIRRFYVY